MIINFAGRLAGFGLLRIIIQYAAFELLNLIFAALVMGLSDVVLAINSVRLYVKKWSNTYLPLEYVFCGSLMPGPNLKPFDILELSKKLVAASYSLTIALPPEEKTNLSLYIREAAVKVYLNTIRAVFLKKRKSKKKFIKTAKNSLVIIDAVIEVLVEVSFVKEEATTEVLQLSSTCYQALDRLRKRK